MEELSRLARRSFVAIDGELLLLKRWARSDQGMRGVTHRL